MATNNLSKGYTKNLNNFTYLKTPLEQVAEFIDVQQDKLNNLLKKNYEIDEDEDLEDEEIEMSEADKIEERGIAQFEDDRQSNFDRE
jgi:hypothetical protein